MRRCILVISLIATLAFSSPVAAYSVFTKACSVGGAGSTACTAGNGSTDPISGPNGLIKKISVIIASVAGIAAIIIIMLSSFQFITAQGNPQKIAQARTVLLGAVIGLIIILGAEGIVILVLNKV